MKKIIDKIKNIRPVNKKLIIAIVVLILIETTAFRWYYNTINPYIAELNIVYTPKKPAYDVYYWHWTDISEHYAFRLSNREEKIIIQEFEDGKWSEMTYEHTEILDWQREEFLDNNYQNHKCYICIYDEQNNEVITDTLNDMVTFPCDRIVFLYDTETNKYYCFFDTM